MGKCNKDAMVHYMFKGFTDQNFQIMVYSGTEDWFDLNKQWWHCNWIFIEQTW